MMAPTRIRGFRELQGSWKTACTEARYSRRSAPVNSLTSLPLKRMAPPVGVSTCKTMRAVVVLPQPDSPTRL